MTHKFGRAYTAQFQLMDILRINPTEPQRRAIGDLLQDLHYEGYQQGFEDGMDHMENPER